MFTLTKVYTNRYRVYGKTHHLVNIIRTSSKRSLNRKQTYVARRRPFHTHMYVYMYVCMYIYIYIYIHIHIHIHTHT